MFLSSLVIDGFRNLNSQHLDFSANKNYLFGENAQGKTNLLELIYLLCLCKSFRTSNDAEMIPLGRDYFNITGHFVSQNHIEHEINLRFHPASGKQVVLDGKPVHQLSSLVGQFPVVVLSVADYDITHGSPQQRRRFFNILASQCSARYLSDLKEYEKIVKQRNRILWLAQTGKVRLRDDLDVWDEQLVVKGVALMAFRSRLVDEMTMVIKEHYQTISGNDDENLCVEYHPNVEDKGNGNLLEQFRTSVQRMKNAEAARAISLVGPHRDEFKFTIGRRTLRQFGSRGEHKSALISIKAAELALLKKHGHTTPLLLLDDLYAELDQERSERVGGLFSQEGQCFISGTSADFSSLQHQLPRKNGERVFFVRGGWIETSDHDA
jgi:DNA replication and repair protein RecF